ncbi:PASTA domain-containing protein [Nocardioides sp.]|uniref:PASTA domain-containing protein n=1 Tax=Nocardioides sp. TaxID=35761 RepID=UPI002EDB5688
MDTQQLIDRLEERAAEIPVGPPPVALMRTRARRHRQGRVAILASAAAVAAIAGGLAWQGSGGADDGSRTPIASDAPADPDTPPDGYRYVGIGDVVAAVPQGWGTNKTDCGTPQEDTVVIDQGVTCLALVPRPADVDSLAIQPTFEGLDTSGWTVTEVAGQRALRSPLSRQDGVVRQTVVVPGADVAFVAESSSTAGASVVGDLLDGITVLQQHTTVPAFQDLGYDADPASMVDSYVERLAELGLAAEVTEGNGRGLDAGTVLETDPAVGSVLAPGDTVRVVVAR